jgi:mono/diheme cytochrome c family protein
MFFRPILLIVGAAATGLLALSCGGGEPEAPISAEAMAEAQAKYDSTCATCHGKSGIGDGPGAVALNPKPRNYTDKAWQKSVTDEYLAKAIVGGGPAVGKSALMPPNADLADKPEVVKGLVAIVRGFAK